MGNRACWIGEDAYTGCFNGGVVEGKMKFRDLRLDIGVR